MSKVGGHVLAVLAILMWGVTFVSTKTLLESFNVVSILCARFTIAYILMSIICPRPLKFTSLKNELMLFSAGFFGICVYFIMENVALSHTAASNAAILVSTSPIFTGIISYVFLKKRLSIYFFIGFMMSVAGIFITVTNGNFSEVKINPFGDVLCIVAASIWGLYTVILSRVLAAFQNENEFRILKRIFFYGLVSVTPYAIFSKAYEVDVSLLFENRLWMHLLFLGVCASTLCYAMWNVTIRMIGIIRAEAYIYAIPLIGILGAHFGLGEEISYYLIVGGTLIVSGVVLSQK